MLLKYAGRDGAVARRWADLLALEELALAVLRRAGYPAVDAALINQTQTTGSDLAKGVRSSETDPNGLSVSWQHDAFGRVKRETRIDGTYTVLTLTTCNSTNSYCGTGYSVADPTYLTNYGYDATSGLLDSLTYPTSTSS